MLDQNLAADQTAALMSLVFSPFRVKGVRFKNRILRSSLGGRMANYDGTVTEVWKNFEKLFADHEVGGIISTTLNVNERRHSPLEYPPISNDRFIKPLESCIREVQKTGCRYIVQLGDPGYATQTSLFAEREDCLSSSSGFDFFYGYGNRRKMMTGKEIEEAIANFVNAAVRVEKIGADGIEITAAKGYLIHQFLNPGLNRRTDDYGGDATRRFRFLKEIVERIRHRLPDILLGVKLSARDDNYLPLQNFRLPIVWNLKHHFIGNTATETLVIAKELERLGVDYLHVVSGCGFISPLDTPGPIPQEEARIFFSSTRHLSAKAAIRQAVANLTPRYVANVGWYREADKDAGTATWPAAGLNLVHAEHFKKNLGIAVVANGGLKNMRRIADALRHNQCDMVSIGRGLLAQPDLVQQFMNGVIEPKNGCTYCNRCAGRTATSPLGCYNPARFSNRDEMHAQILALNQPDVERAPLAL